MLKRIRFYDQDHKTVLESFQHFAWHCGLVTTLLHPFAYKGQCMHVHKTRRVHAFVDYTKFPGTRKMLLKCTHPEQLADNNWACFSTFRIIFRNQHPIQEPRSASVWEEHHTRSLTFSLNSTLLKVTFLIKYFLPQPSSAKTVREKRKRKN